MVPPPSVSPKCQYPQCHHVNKVSPRCHHSSVPVSFKCHHPCSVPRVPLCPQSVTHISPSSLSPCPKCVPKVPPPPNVTLSPTCPLSATTPSYPQSVTLERHCHVPTSPKCCHPPCPHSLSVPSLSLVPKVFPKCHHPRCHPNVPSQ